MQENVWLCTVVERSFQSFFLQQEDVLSKTSTFCFLGLKFKSFGWLATFSIGNLLQVVVLICAEKWKTILLPIWGTLGAFCFFWQDLKEFWKERYGGHAKNDYWTRRKP